MKRAVLAMVTGATVVLSTPSCAQTVTRDPQSGAARITYDVNGRTFSVDVPSHGRISPKIELVSLTVSGDTLTYVYRVENGTEPPAEAGRGVITMILPCAGASQQLNPPRSQPVGWRMTVYSDGSSLSDCYFEGSEAGVINIGQATSGFAIRSTALPGLDSARFVGVSGGAQVATGEDTPDTVYRLINNLSDGGRTAVAILPTVPRQQVATVGPSLSVLRERLMTACSPLNWVDNLGTCRSLQAKLDAAAASLGRGQTTTARNQLSAFRAELDAQRGQHVNENAYFLLGVIADHTLALLH